jgi:hypothetical protein
VPTVDQVVNGTAASIVFMSAAGENHVGLDGDLRHDGHGDTMFLSGPHTGWSGGEPTPAPKANQWHTITLSRVNGVLTVDVDGRVAFSVRSGPTPVCAQCAALM